jgi:hypothetical protein
MQWAVQRVINKFKASLKGQLRGLNVEERNHGRLRYCISAFGGLMVESKFYQTAINEFIVPFLQDLRWRFDLAHTLKDFCEAIKDLQSKMMAKIWYKQARI